MKNLLFTLSLGIIAVFILGTCYYIVIRVMEAYGMLKNDWKGRQHGRE